MKTSTRVFGGVFLGLLAWDSLAIQIIEPRHSPPSDQTLIKQSTRQIRLAESGLITPAQKQQLATIAKQIVNSTDPKIIRSNWSAFIGSIAKKGRPVHTRIYIHSLMADIDAIQRGYFESTRASVRIFSQRKQLLQKQLGQARTQGDSRLFNQLMTRLQANQAGLQVANTNHQNTQQRQQQLLQIMMPISRMLHDTAMNVINTGH